MGVLGGPEYGRWVGRYACDRRRETGGADDHDASDGKQLIIRLSPYGSRGLVKLNQPQERSGEVSTLKLPYRTTSLGPSRTTHTLIGEGIPPEACVTLYEHDLTRVLVGAVLRKRFD